MSIAEIHQLLESPTVYGPTKIERLRYEAADEDVVALLQQATAPNIRLLLHQVLELKKAKTAVPLLIEQLNDPDPDIRDSAADTLGAIGDPRAGEALFRRFSLEETDQTLRPMLAAALGGVGYRPAIPMLMETLFITDAPKAKVLRQMASEALRSLKAVEALPVLKQAITQESNDYVRYRMQVAVEAIQNSLL
jgi:HEAT repeat protein